MTEPTGETRAVPRPTTRQVTIVIATLIVGAGILAWLITIEPGDRTFLLATVLLAAVWTIGAFLTGRPKMGHPASRVPGRIALPAVLGVVAGLSVIVVFVVGALIVTTIPSLRELVRSVLDHRNAGLFGVVTLTLVAGASEELFFRGALYDVLRGRHPIVFSTLIYTLTTVATGNWMLVFAALVLGALTGTLRYLTDGILASVLTHCIWSAGMLLALPAVLG
ncbi:type II CAAX endopeptidase family protein [Nakamurella sp. A5-74]|uniref:Type II CAAX endopeptidase family protein n=1 Tax=Nakamurella sp. A5-74 TaxID=3158264 RepID=A0AAU8DT90_9ACTN